MMSFAATRLAPFAPVQEEITVEVPDGLEWQDWAWAAGVLVDPEPRVLVTEFGESSINFVVNYWHVPDIASTNRIRSGVAMAIKDALDVAGIEIPFPQRVVTMVDAGGEG